MSVSILTPAFVDDEAALRRALSWLAPLRAETGFKLLFSIKALPFVDILECLRPLLDGFSVRSLFEARLAREVLGNKGMIHITTPGLRADELSEAARRHARTRRGSTRRMAFEARVDQSRRRVLYRPAGSGRGIRAHREEFATALWIGSAV
ncbi:MAG: hypothetical protein ACREXS_10130 [Gammaproteobacteria bacterium]